MAGRARRGRGCRSELGEGMTLKVRHDADDTRSVLDIERVATGLAHRKALFGFATFEPFAIDDIGGGGRFQFSLDTKHLKHDDFRLYFIYWLATDELLCRLQTDHGLTIGEPPVRFDGMSMSCGIPKWWLDIREPVQFTVGAYDTNRRVEPPRTRAATGGFDRFPADRGSVSRAARSRSSDSFDDVERRGCMISAQQLRDTRGHSTELRRYPSPGQAPDQHLRCALRRRRS